MRITISGDTDEERAMLDLEWKALDAEARTKAVPKPIVIADVVDCVIAGNKAVQGLIPMAFTHTHINSHRGTADLVGQCHAVAEKLRQAHDAATLERLAKLMLAKLLPPPPKETRDGDAPV